MTIALVTDEASLPIDYDMSLLLAACHDAGLATEVCSWEDASVPWPKFDAVLLRSPWTYVDRLPEFLAWCQQVTGTTELLNPLPVVRWTLDKRYMGDLAARGVPVVPSAFMEPGTNGLKAVRAFLDEHPRAEEIVVKPTVGAYSKDVRRFRRSQLDEAAEHAAAMLRAGRHVALQPYLGSIDIHGETDLIYFDGSYSHAIRKAPLLMPDGTVNVPTFDARSAREADTDERAVASAALDAARACLQLDQPLLYGRVDLVRGDDGHPRVLELELCEPSLSLPFTDRGATLFARALVERLR